MPRRHVRDPHGGVGLVHVLAAGARRAERVDAQVRGIDRDIGDRIGLRQHGDRARGRVDAALRLGLRHALHAMAAGFELELRIRARADDARDDLPIAAEIRRRLRHDLDRPAAPLGIARVHAEQHGGEQRRLLAAGPRTDLDEHVALVARILRQQHRLQLAFERAKPRLGGALLLLGVVAHLRIVRELDRGREIRFGLRRTRRTARRPDRSRHARATSSDSGPGRASLPPTRAAHRAPPSGRSTGRASCAAIASRGNPIGRLRES